MTYINIIAFFGTGVGCMFAPAGMMGHAIDDNTVLVLGWMGVLAMAFSLIYILMALKGSVTALKTMLLISMSIHVMLISIGTLQQESIEALIYTVMDKIPNIVISILNVIVLFMNRKTEKTVKYKS